MPSDSPPKDPADVGTQRVLLVATGPDHPGILDEISHYTADRGARIEATRVASLSGRVALLMLLAADPRKIRALRGDLAILTERTGVRASIESADDVAQGSVAATRLELNVAAAHAATSDVVRQISNLLRVLNINIVDVKTQPSGSGGFAMHMQFDVPRDVPVGKLRELLGQLLNAARATWELHPVAGRLK